jgi:hypothetical protein
MYFIIVYREFFVPKTAISYNASLTVTHTETLSKNYFFQRLSGGIEYRLYRARFLKFQGAQESIPRNQFRQPM